MIEASIARRYARALIELAREEGKIEAYALLLQNFQALCRENALLLDTLTNRFFDLAARLRIVDRLAQKLDLALSVKNFIKLLIKKGRIGLFGDIVLEYQREVYLFQNKVVATIVSARDLPDSITREIQSILAKKTGKDVVVEKEVKPNVLGGVCVRMGGEVYDGTVKAAPDCLTQKKNGV